MNNQNYTHHPALVLVLLRYYVRSFTDLRAGFFTYCKTVRMLPSGVNAFLITLRPYTIHYAGKKSRFIFLSANIIVLFVQP